MSQVPHTPQFGYGPPPAKRSKWPWLLAAAGVSALLCCGVGAVVAMNASDPDPSGEAAPAAARIGQPARDGKFEFVVASVDCGRTKVGADIVQETAQGVFCLVKVSVRNIGDKAQMFDGSAQKAFNAAGVEFSNDAQAEMIANEGTPTFLQEINPGNRAQGTLIFDVPKGTKLTRIELHDSAFSDGVAVALS